mgnify:CR=1 FL=1
MDIQTRWGNPELVQGRSVCGACPCQRRARVVEWIGMIRSHAPLLSGHCTHSSNNALRKHSSPVSRWCAKGASHHNSKHSVAASLPLGHCPLPTVLMNTARPPAHRPAQDIDHFRYALTEESQTYLTAGSPEAQVFAAVGADGISLAELKVRVRAWVLGMHKGEGVDAAHANAQACVYVCVCMPGERVWGVHGASSARRSCD